MSQKLIYRAIFILSAGIALQSGCGGRREASSSSAALEEQYRVEAIEVTEIMVEPEINSFGSISFRRKTDISPAVEGVIGRIFVEEGDSISSGQILAVIENIQLEIRRRQSVSELTSARAALRLAEMQQEEGRLQLEARTISLQKMELNLEQKARELVEQEQTVANKEQLLAVDGISQEELRLLKLRLRALKTEQLNLEKDLAISRIGLRDKDILRAGHLVPTDPAEKQDLLIELNTRTLKARADVARARVVTAQADLESVDLLVTGLTVRARSPGILGARYLEEGERITPQDKLFTTFESTEVFAAFPVPERDALRIAPDQMVQIIVPALNDLSLTGTVQVISPTVNPQSGNLTVKALLPNRDLLLRPGMFVQVRRVAGKPEAKILVPESVLFRKRGSRGELFRLVGNRVFIREVQTAAAEGGQVEITAGLNPGDRVVNNPPPFLKEGQYVSVK